MSMFDDLVPGKKQTTGMFDDLVPEQPSAAAQAGRRIADVGVSALKGAVSVPESIVGMANLVTGGEAGKLVEDAGFDFKAAKEGLDTLYSDEQKAANAEVDQAKGFFPTAGAMLKNPSTILHAAVESAPSMIPGAVIGRGVMAAAPKLGAIAGGAIGEGAVAAGASAEQVRQQNPEGDLSGTQAAITALSGAATGALGFAGGRVANKLGIGDVDTMLTAGRTGIADEARDAAAREAAEAAANKGIFRKIGEGAVAEGVLQEMPQSFQEQVAQNIALDKPWNEGAAEAAAQGMLAGGLMGAISGPLGSPASAGTTDSTDTAGAADPANPANPANPAAGAGAPPVPATPVTPAAPAAPAPNGPLSAAAALVTQPNADPAAPRQFPFGDMAMAQKQADSLSQSTGIPHEAGEHPTVPGRFAATPVAIRGSDPLFTAEAERQGLDPAVAQLLTNGPQAQELVKSAMEANPGLDPQQWRDPAVRAQLGAAYLKRQLGELESAIARPPTPAEAYIAQLVGVPTAASMLNTPEAERAIPVSTLIPDPAQEDRLGLTGMPISAAIDFLTKQADNALATLKEQGNANLDTGISGTGSANGGSRAGAGVGDAAGNAAVPGRPARGTGADAGALSAAAGNAGTDAPHASPVASPRVVVGPSETGFQNVNAQRHRDKADELGVTGEIESLFGDGLTFNQVMGQMQDKVPGMVPADLPNFLLGVQRTLGIPDPISPEGKGAFDAWRAQYKERMAAPPAPSNAGAAKVTPEAIQPKNEIDLAAHEASNSPLNERPLSTPGQQEANNYKVGRAEVHGLKIGIENPKGSTRTGFDPDGNAWSTLMTAHYGRFTGTKGADGDAVDTFIGDQPDSPRVFVVDQIDPKTGEFDEHKVILGVNSQQEALDLYNDNYAPGWKGAKAVTETTPDVLKTWLKMGDTTSEFARVATPAAEPATAPIDGNDAQRPQDTLSPAAPDQQQAAVPVADRWASADANARAEMLRAAGRDDIADDFASSEWEELSDRARQALSTLPPVAEPAADAPQAAAPSQQFESYRKAIEQGQTSTGMLEQIAADERLNDGEAEQLAALASGGAAQQAQAPAQDIKGGEPQDVSPQVLKQRLQNYKEDGTDEQGNRVFRQFSEGGVKEIAVDNRGRIVRDFSVADTYDLDDNRSVELSYNGLTNEWQATEYGSDNTPLKSVPVSKQDLQRQDREAMLGEKFGASKVEELNRLVARTPAREWAARPDARKQPGFHRRQFESDLTRYEAGIVGTRTDPRTLPAHKELGKKLGDPANYITPPDQIPAALAKIENELGHAQKRYDDLVAEQKELEKNGANWTLVNPLNTARRTLASLNETRESLLKAQGQAAAAPAAPVAGGKAPKLEIPKPAPEQTKAAAQKVAASPYFAIDGLTYGKAQVSKGGESVWAGRAFPEGAQAPAGEFGTAPYEFTEHEGKLYKVDPIGNGKVRLSEVTLLDKPLPVDPNNPHTGYVKPAPKVDPAVPAERGFDSEKWNKERDDRIKASKAAGNKHLDDLPRDVEGMRGKPFYYAHDPKERGVVRSVDNHGNVVVHWNDQYAAEKNLASETRDGKKQVWQSTLSPSDLKDYVVGMPKADAVDKAKAEPAPDTPGEVNYPNRKLGFEKARTSEQDEYNDHAWANIAAANMQVGDTFELNGKQTTVQSITGKTLTLVQAEKNGMDRKKRTLNPDSVTWDQFKRDLGGQLTVENLQANNILKPKRPLIDILKRDPAVHVDKNGSVFLRDGGVVAAPDGEAAPAPAQFRAFTEAEKQAIASMTIGTGRQVNEALKLGLGTINPATIKVVRTRLLAMDPDLVRPHIIAGVEYAEGADARREKDKATPAFTQPVVTAGEDGKPVVDLARLVFKGTGDSSMEVSDTLRERVQEALRTHPDAYELSRRYSKDDTRITLPKSPNGPNAPANGSNGGQFQIRDDGRVFLLGDDEYGWASTMSQKSVTRTLTNWLRNHIEGKSAPTTKQEKVQEYDPGQAKSLLLIACTDKKLSGKHRAIELYQGGLFEVMNKWKPQEGVEVYVISAKHGLLHADTMVQTYDQKMTAERQQELIAKGIPVKDFAGKHFKDVFIAGSQLYRPVGEAFAEQLRAAGVVGPEAPVKATEGFIGQQRSQLGDYLRAVEAAKVKVPETPAPLGVGVQVRVKYLEHPPRGTTVHDANKYAGRIGIVEREMLVGESRYFAVKLAATPLHVEKDVDFFRDDLEVLTPASEAGVAAPGPVPTEPDARKAWARDRIDEQLNANETLVAQADLLKTGNKFEDFAAEYKAAFEKALAGLFDTIGAETYGHLQNSLDKLPGYASRAARQFISDHHGTGNRDTEESARRWGFAPGTVPAGGYFENYETALHYDNMRTGKDQLSARVTVAQAPNGLWAMAATYKQGGTGGNGIAMGGADAPSLASDMYKSRQQAVEAGGAAINAHMRAHGQHSLRFTGAILTAVKQVAEAEKAKAAEQTEQKRVVRGFASVEDEVKIVKLQQDIARHAPEAKSGKTAQDRQNAARALKAARTELGKMRPGRFTPEGAIELGADRAAPLESPRFKRWLEDVRTRIAGKTRDDLETLYARYLEDNNGSPPLSRHYFIELLAEQDAANKAKPALPGWLGSLPEGHRESVFAAMRALREIADTNSREYQQLAPRNGEIPAGGAHVDAFIRSQGVSTLLMQLGKGDTVAEAVAAAKREVASIVNNWNKNRSDYQVHRSPGTLDTTLEDYGRRLTRAAEAKVDAPQQEPTAPAPEQAAPAKFDIGNPPTLDYRLKTRGGTLYLVPPVGKGFTKETRAALRDWLRAAGYFSNATGDHEISASQLTGGPSTDLIPDGVEEQKYGRQVEKDKAKQDGSLAGDRPMDRNTFMTDLRNHGKVQFGDATFEVKHAGRGGFGRIQADTFVVNATYPTSNKVIGFGEHLSLQQAVERTASEAFDWWDNHRVKEAEFAKKRAKLVRAGERELFGALKDDAELMKKIDSIPVEFGIAVNRAVVEWVAKERAAGELDPDRKLMLDNLVINGKSTLSHEWTESLRKFVIRAAKRAEKETDRDPAVYQAALIAAAQKVGIAPDVVAVFKAGWDHALKGNTKSTLPPVTQMQQGYEAGADWMKTDEGKGWFEGRRGKKLENTGAALRRWFDERTRKIKEVTAENLPASYQIIKDQTSRADAFANLAGEGATPGTTRYINALRDNLKPFQEWLLDTGPLRRLYGEIGYREADSTKIARYLDGRAYSADTDPVSGKWIDHKDATPEDRLALLQEAAADYMERLKGLTDALAGAKTVAEAAQRMQDALVADKQKSTWASDRPTELGKRLAKLTRKSFSGFEPGSYQERSFGHREAEADDASNRKQALLVPKLDRVVREGEGMTDWRKGQNVTPQQMKETFGFADVGFGRYVAARQDQDHLNYAYDAFMDLANLIGMDPKHIGLGGKLHFAVGALGHGRHAAHFQPEQQHPDGGKVPVINVTNTKGDGTVAHEWFHALDHALNVGSMTVAHGDKSVRTWRQHPAIGKVVHLLSTRYDIENLAKRLRSFTTGGSWLTYGNKKAARHDLKTEAGLIANGEDGLRYYMGKQSTFQTDYKQNADAMGADYWGNPKELLARAAEAWAMDTLDGTSNYLVNPAWVGEGVIKAPAYKGAPYPMGDERRLFNEAMGALVKSLKFDDKGVTLDQEVFDKEFPDIERQYEEGAAALKAQIPSMVRQHLAAKEAKKIAEQHAKNEAERAKQEQARAEQAAREAAERELEAARLREELAKAEAAPAAPPAGPLSMDQLEALFDQAESELAEENQEKPKAEAPGEPAQIDRWTQEDINYLIKTFDAGTVFLLADGSLGLPTIHDMPSNATRHMGMGVFQTKTGTYDATWDGGGAMQKTPGGKSFTTVQIKDGRGAFLESIGWDNVKTKLQAKLIVKAGPKAAPTLSSEQQKSAGKLIAEAAKLGVTGINEALEGLVQIFGGNSLKSFPAGMDEESYKRAKPHFERSLKAFQEAGKTLVDLFKMLITHFGPGVRPYALYFAQEQGLSANLAAAPSGTERVAQQVQKWLADGTTINSKALFEAADAAFGGTQAENKYSVKDAYDAMEAGMNRHIMQQGITPDGSATDAVHKIARLEGWTAQLATQTRRTAEMDEFQQFSTPPAQAFVAGWVANVRPGEQFLEPSAGSGSLAIYGQLAGADVVVNELSSRRAEVLKTVLPQARLFKENAEQLNNILPDDVAPSVIVMNPPFSSTAGRIAGERSTMNGGVHIEQALKRLADGGRLVAIVGNGMAEDRPAFKAWWKKIKEVYNVRVNIGVDGSNYAKYGTTFDNQILVIDKTGPTTGTVLTGQAKTLAELPALLEGVRNDRQSATGAPGARDAGQPATAEQGGEPVSGGSAAGNGTGRADADPVGAGERADAGTAGTGGAGRGEDDGNAQRDGDQVGPEGSGTVPDQPRKPGGRGANGGRSGGAGGRGGSGGTADREPVQRDGGERPVTGEITVEAADAATPQGELSDAIFENYTPQRLSIPGAKPHPGKLVQSAAMAAVLPPAPTYSPNLPKAVIEKGLLSLAQLEAVVYAGQAHSEMLPGDKERRGFFIGDGTGVGKGREIAGILLDNWRSGRTKAVWLSAKKGLLRDAKRDFGGISGDPSMILEHGKTKADATIDAKQGILFTTYDTLRSGAIKPEGSKGKGKSKGEGEDKAKKPGKSRLDQIVAWLGEDFDGVIAFDEAHNMGNVLPKKGKRGTSKPAAKALAGVELQARLPKARIVYVSATGATEVNNLGYATRLGLWGEGSAFAKVTDFVGGIESGGVAAMELVSRDMKAQGSYLARSLSFDGVTYDRLEHNLSPLQTDIYNELAKAWQVVLQNINAALEATGQNKEPKAKSAALAQFWGSHQRFFNHVITSMQMPSIIQAAQNDLDAGHAVVMQLVNTNEAEQDRQAAKLASDDDAVPEDFDFTPRETLLNYVRHAFPVTQYEEYTDEEGNKRMRQVTDSNGRPVENRDMVAKRDALVKNLEMIRVPDNPLDMILAAFGTDNVAEITGRKRRFVQVRDKKGGFTVVEEKRPASSVPADADSFMEDKKRVLVFSDAGGTGYSFQSDLGVKNQRRRMHYLVQPGWRANNAVQGFGRTHRSNEANQPHYVLPTTNLKAQKRFISSIARRLDQLGALTKGQRETGGQGMFSATDNLESQYAADALQTFFTDMYNKQAKLDFHETTEAMGLNGLIQEDTGALNMSKLPDVPQFLNRLLSLTTDKQDEVFEEFFTRLEEVIARAKANGTFDAGMETLVAQKVEKTRDEIVYSDRRTGANTRYVELELTHPTHFNPFETAQRALEAQGDRFLGYYRNERTGKVFGLIRTGTATDHKTGALVTRGARLHTTDGLKYGDEIDKILSGSRSNGKKVKKTITVQTYKAPEGGLSESYDVPGGGTREITDAEVARLLSQYGVDRVRANVRAVEATPKNTAALRLIDKMMPHLTDSQAEREIPAFMKLSEEQARAEWDAEIASTPDTYTSKTHLLTGMLLPIWDRLPGDPRVVRTQTVDGERLLGRVVAARNLDKTLKNLGVGSDLDKLPPATVLQRLLDGERAILANGWLLSKVRVSNENRIEVTGASLGYSMNDRSLLIQQGAFSERINWQERVFVPTGEKGAEVLGRILANKPLVELGKPGQSEEDEADFSRGAVEQGMARADVERTAQAVARGWVNGPAVQVVQSVRDLPFKAPSDARGALYQGKVWLVADNLAHDGEVQFVLAHEALGHLGLAAIMGPDALAKEMNRLRLINPELAKAARAQVSKYGYDMQLATEEALADMAGSGKTINGWQQFVAKVQAALRAIGLDRVADWIEGHTQAETMSLLRRAREAIEGRKTPRTFGQEQAVRFSDGQADRWYSQLARQIEKLPTKSATALSWAETIMGGSFAQKGVKQDEIYWTGVLEWLELQGRDTKVPKQALLDYLAENGVRVEETMFGDPTEEDIELLLNDEAGEGMTREDAVDYLRGGEDSTKYRAYTLDGGESYRELLLTLPTKPLASSTLARIEGELKAMDALDTREQFDAWNKLADAKQAELERLRKAELEGLYRSSHWNQKNVLAHVRFNDRVDTEGRRVLFVEELQSDWAQQGRRDGFRAAPVSVEELNAANAAARAVIDENDFLGFNYAYEAMDAVVQYPDWKDRWKVKTPEQAAVIDRFVALRQQSLNSERGVAHGPFVGKTDAWLTLALKRVVTFAAEHGYDRVAFVNGRQAADRFRLSRQVESIEWEDAVVMKGGTRVHIKLIGESSQALFVERDTGKVFKGTGTLGDMVGQRLDAVLGKEMADKILSEREGSLRGNGLNIGGEGMRAFYDKLVPNTVNTLLKQLGGGRVEEVDVVLDEPYDPEPGTTNYIDEEGRAQVVWHGEDAGYGANRYFGHKGWTTQRGFEITDAMRERAKGGLPLFSRAGNITRQAAGTVKKYTYSDVKNKLVDYRGIGLQMLGRRQIMDMYGKLFPQGTKDNLLEQYNKLAMQMDADKNEAGAEADHITTEWAKLKDERELAELMHDATRLQIDPSKPYVPGDNRIHFADLDKRYKALSNEARKIFHDASNAYTKHYDAVRAAVRERIVRAMPGHPNQAAMLQKMDSQFFGTIKGIYFPLARFGDYMVQVKWTGVNPPPGQTPAREAVHFAETMAEAEALQAELANKYPASQGYQISKVTRRAEYNAARDAVGRGFLQELFNVFKNTGVDPALQDAINQLYLTSLPDLSWAKHGIHRKGTPGFSQDARRAFASHMFHGARYLAKLNYADQMTQALDDMQDYANAHAQDAGYDQVKAQQVVDEMLKRHEVYMNPTTSKLSTWLTSAGFIYYLGLSPASAVVNLSQTALVAYPLLGARYGYAKVGKALLEASAVAMKGHNDLAKVLTGDELKAYQGWIKAGVIDVSMAHDLAGVAQGEDQKIFGQFRNMMKVFSFMFHHAEKFNRQATALAAYRLARAAGMDHDKAYDAAVTDTYAGHFDYSAGNRPRLMQGDVARVVLLFKQYAQNMIYTLGRNARLAFKGDKRAMKALSGLLVSHALAAGVLGLPVVGPLLAVASALGSDDDEPWDAEVALRNMLADAFGDKAGEVMAHGLSRLTPWDISSRVGLNQLLLPDFQEGLEGARMAESVVTRLLGPIPGVGVNVAKGMHSIAEGDYLRGWEQMLPVFMRSPLKAIRYWQEGVVDTTGVEVLPETTLAEEAGQFVGFSAGRAREAQEAKSAVYQADRALQARRQELVTQYAHKVMEQEDVGKTMAEIRAFNELHPNRLIAPLHLMQSVRRRMERKALADRGIYLPPKRAMDAMRAGNFADERGED